MKINKKIDLTPAQREELEKKEMRNEMIGLGLSVVAGIAGFLVQRKLVKDLESQLTAMQEPKEDEVTD